MGFSTFRVGVFFRVTLLSLAVSAFVYLVSDPGKMVSAIIVGLLAFILVLEIIRYVEKTNRKLTRFFESVRYADFISGFTSDSHLGSSFAELNDAFNEVLEAFRQTRSEKEEHWQYLNTVVQHVTTGLLSFDEEGNVELINNRAKQFLDAPQLRKLDELAGAKDDLLVVLRDLKPGGNHLYRPNSHTHLAIQATELKLRGKTFKLVSLQNIQSELQRNEIEAWQNLTRVLRHEIMNSITPIASLTSTLNEILIEDLVRKENTIEITEDTIDDLEEGLTTISSRSTGLIRFVEAYRDYTAIPQPNIQTVSIRELLDQVANLEKVEIRKAKVDFSYQVEPDNLEIAGDDELLEMVLINLVKNGIEAVNGIDQAFVKILATNEGDGSTTIKVVDNGGGIIPEAIDRIFVPFYTTKNTGSGIGLALSRQIMQLHNGTLTVESKVGGPTTFTMRFNSFS